MINVTLLLVADTRKRDYTEGTLDFRCVRDTFIWFQEQAQLLQRLYIRFSGADGQKLAKIGVDEKITLLANLRKIELQARKGKKMFT